MSITPGAGDDWHALTTQGQYKKISTTAVAKDIAEGFVTLLADDGNKL
jgi:hypothetical protein